MERERERKRNILKKNTHTHNTHTNQRSVLHGWIRQMYTLYNLLVLWSTFHGDFYSTDSIESLQIRKLHFKFPSDYIQNQNVFLSTSGVAF